MAKWVPPSNDHLIVTAIVSEQTKKIQCLILSELYEFAFESCRNIFSVKCSWTKEDVEEKLDQKLTFVNDPFRKTIFGHEWDAKS